MKRTGKTGSPAYLGALKKLTDIIHAEYPDGGKLPGAPEMCKRLGICMVTYIKILKILSNESLLMTTKGRGGTYVPPKNERRTKIGIVVRNAEESPFLGEIPEMTEAFKTLNEERFVLHLLQASHVEDVYEKALIHAVDALLWFRPDMETLSVIGQIQRETDMSILTLDLWNRDVCQFVEQQNMEAVNRKWQGRWNRFYSERLMETFHRKGIPFTPEHNILPVNVRKQLPGRLKELHPTLIISEGGFNIYRQVCDLISALPPKNRPALLIRNAGNLPGNGMKSLYPGIRFAGKMRNDFEQVGREGALMMVRHLRNGEPLVQKKIRCFSIQP